MTKIVLHKAPQPNIYRAVIGGDGLGWAISLKAYKDGQTAILEAVVQQHGKPGTARYRFTFDGEHWTTDSDPISQHI